MRSRHSRRVLPTSRSQTAFALGARTGVRNTRTPVSETAWSTCLEKMVVRRQQCVRPLMQLWPNSIDGVDRRGEARTQAARHRFCAPRIEESACPYLSRRGCDRDGNSEIYS